MNIRRGVLILVSFNAQFLLVKQNHGGWSLPSGGTERNETSLEAAKRELYEETGIIANTMTLTDIVNEFFYDEDTRGVQECFIYKSETNQIPGVVLTQEILETKWVHKEDAKEYLLKPNQYEIFLSLCEKIH